MHQICTSKNLLLVQEQGHINIKASLTDNMKSVAKALGKDLYYLTGRIQDSPRHDHLIKQVFDVGARVKLFNDGGVTGAIDRYGNR